MWSVSYGAYHITCCAIGNLYFLPVCFIPYTLIIGIIYNLEHSSLLTTLVGKCRITLPVAIYCLPCWGFKSNYRPPRPLLGPPRPLLW